MEKLIEEIKNLRLKTEKTQADYDYNLALNRVIRILGVAKVEQCKNANDCKYYNGSLPVIADKTM